MELMDALVCVKPGILRVMQRPMAVRGPNDVLVRPLRIGICGTDYHIFEGNQPFLDYPRVMGHELAVEIVDAPAGSGLSQGNVRVVNPYLSCGTCRACLKGKPNCCANLAVLGVHRDGGMTSFLSVPQQNLIAADGLNADECAMVEFLAIGAHAVRRGAVGSGDRALVIGAGPIGLGVGLFAALSGADVTMMDRDQGRLDAAAQLLPVAGSILAAGDVGALVSRCTDGAGFDVVFDATGSRQSIETAFDYATNGGRYVLVSIVKGNITFVDSDFHRKELTLLGSRNATAEDFERVIAAIKAGHAPSNKWITHRTSLQGAVRDIPNWANKKSGLIKAVIEVS